MAGGIFISYRRDDSRHVAGRLVDRLAQTFKRDQLFMDVDAIEPGLDFVKVLTEKVQKVRDCDVFLAVVGPQWISATDANGRKRLDDPNDFVRVELEAALQRDIRVIPVLVDGAQMPLANELPEPLSPLARRNAVRLTHERFGSEATALATSLKSVVSRKRSGGRWWPADNTPRAQSGSGMAAGADDAAVTLRLKGATKKSARSLRRAGQVALIALAGSAVVAAAWFVLGRIEPFGDFVMLRDTELTGTLIFATSMETRDDCTQRCRVRSDCRGFTFLTTSRICYLVSPITGQRPNNAYSSGTRR